MNPATDSEGLESFIGKWLAVQPELRLALPFVDPVRHPGHLAMAALEQELLGAAYGIQEPQVAAVKLNWWAEELAAAPASGGRHPLTRALFDDPRAARIGTATWLGPVQAALAQLEEGTPPDFAAQMASAGRLHGALAALETAWWYGPDVAAERAAREATLVHLLHALRRLEDDAAHDRLPLPMARLARHGLDRGGLREAGPARDAAVKAQLDDLLAAWREAARLPGPLSVFRALESRAGRCLAGRARGAPAALAELQRPRRLASLGTTLAAWRAARRWRRLRAD